jgi:hypothetical protein
MTFVALAAAAGCRSPVAAESVRTSIRAEDCMPPPAADTVAYAARDLGVQECPAPDGWRLLLVSSDENTWLELMGPGIRWSAERPVVYDRPPGNFPSVDGPSVEWQRDGNGRIGSVIFRVTGQDREDLQTRRSLFYVLGVKQDSACVVGRVEAIEEARKLVSTGRPCDS